mgnify:CR=1 FL=1
MPIRTRLSDEEVAAAALSAVTATAKPEAVKAAMQKWLTRPVLEIRVEPGEREAYKEVAAGSGSRTGTLTAPAFYAPPGADDMSVSAPVAFQDRSKIP